MVATSWREQVPKARMYVNLKEDNAWKVDGTCIPHNPGQPTTGKGCSCSNLKALWQAEKALKPKVHLVGLTWFFGVQNKWFLEEENAKDPFFLTLSRTFPTAFLVDIVASDSGLKQRTDCVGRDWWSSSSGKHWISEQHFLKLPEWPGTVFHVLMKFLLMQHRKKLLKGKDCNVIWEKNWMILKSGTVEIKLS